MSRFTVRNPDFEQVVRDSFAQQGLMTTFGARLNKVEPGLVEIEVDFDERLDQQQGLFHGGVTTSIVDSSCGYAALTLMDPGCEVLTVEFKINLFAPAQGEKLLARGQVARAGRTITVYQGDSYAIQDGVETHCATMLATMMRVELP